MIAKKPNPKKKTIYSLAHSTGDLKEWAKQLALGEIEILVAVLRKEMMRRKK